MSCYPVRLAKGLGLKGLLHHHVDDHVGVEVWVRDYGMSAARLDEVWRRWRAGESLSARARSLGMPLQHVRRFLAQTGGIQRRPTRRHIQHLTMAEREEICRGLAVGSSARAIATGLNRSPSTIAREIARNGGARTYRAAVADQQAYHRARRSNPARLLQNPMLRELVEDKLSVRWSPEQIAGCLRRQLRGDESKQISHEAICLALFDPRRRGIERILTRRLHHQVALAGAFRMSHQSAG